MSQDAGAQEARLALPGISAAAPMSVMLSVAGVCSQVYVEIMQLLHRVAGIVLLPVVLFLTATHTHAAYLCCPRSPRPGTEPLEAHCWFFPPAKHVLPGHSSRSYIGHMKCRNRQFSRYTCEPQITLVLNS